MAGMNRRDFLKRTGMAGAALAASGLLQACGSAPAAPASEGAAGAAAPSTAVAAGAPVTLSVWFNFGAAFNDTVDRLVNEFQASHANIKIERQELGSWDEMREKTLTAFAAGTGPDIFRIAVFDTALYAVRNAVVPLDEQVAASGMKKEDFIPGFLANVIYDGKMWAMPWKGSAVTFFWNKRLFEEAGLDPEKPPTTWNEVTEYAKQLTKPEQQQYGFQVQYTESSDGMNFFGPLLYSHQGELFDTLDPAAVTKAAFNTENGVAALQWVLDMINVHKAVNPPGVTIQDAQINERVAMWIDGQWLVGTIQKNKPDLRYGTTVLPDTDFGKGTTVTGGDHIAIASVSKKIPEAWQFVSWVNTPEVEKWYWPIIGGLPGRKEVASEKLYAEFPYKAFFDQLEKGAKPRPGVPDISEILASMMVEIQLAEFGKQDAATAMATAEKKVNDILEKRRQTSAG